MVQVLVHAHESAKEDCEIDCVDEMQFLIKRKKKLPHSVSIYNHAAHPNVHQSFDLARQASPLSHPYQVINKLDTDQTASLALLLCAPPPLSLSLSLPVAWKYQEQ